MMQNYEHFVVVLLSKTDQKAISTANNKHKSKLYLCHCVPNKEKMLGYFLKMILYYFKRQKY